MRGINLIIIITIGNFTWAQSNIPNQDSLDVIIAINEQYNKVVTKADELFAEKNYLKALELYERAATIKPSDLTIPGKISLTENKLTCANCNTYEKVIFKADNHYRNDEFVEALELYKRSQIINPADAYPQEMIDKIEQATQ